jgi:hypothetical protein
MNFSSLTWAIFCSALVLTLMAARVAVAADAVHEGKVVSVTEGKGGADGKLVMTDKDGKNEHSHAIASTVKITLDGKDAKLTDLKKGDVIKVTTGASKAVTKVDATRK